MKNVSATALFCEDIRRERAGSETLIGLMPDTFRVQSFPGVLRRMTVYARIRFATDFADFDKPIRLTLTGPLGVEVKGGDEQPVPREIIEKGISRAKESGLPYASIVGRIVLDEPVPIQAAGTMLVYLHCGDEREVCGFLNVTLRDAATASQPPSSQPQADAPRSS